MGSYMGIEWNDDDIVAGDRRGKPTFAVGDKVRVVRLGTEAGGSMHRASVGAVTTIRNAINENYLVADDWAFKAHEIQHAFQPGDRVRLTRTKGYYAAGDRGTVTVTSDETVGVRMDAGVLGLHNWSFSYGVLEPVRDEEPAEPAGKEQPCIVARAHVGLVPWGNGVSYQPLPASHPHVHDTAASAIAEAERLARNNPGQQFDVYQRVTGRVAEQHIEMKEAS